MEKYSLNRHRWKILLIIFCLVFFLFACLGSGVGDKRLDAANIDEALRLASFGLKSGINDMAQNGGDGSWFVLAELAEDSGYNQLAENLRKKSFKKDKAPFAGLSLVRLLSKDPKGIHNPLGELRKAERRFGPDELFRRARIEVLRSLNRKQALLQEMDFFTGQDWEAPVLAAFIEEGWFDSKDLIRIENFILLVSDASILSTLPQESADLLDRGWKLLWEARQAYANGRFVRALEAYRGWLLQVPDSPTDIISPVFEEIAQSARRSDQVLKGAELLFTSASTLSAAKQYAAYYEAGRLFWELGLSSKAETSFLLAAKAAPDDSSGDRALWFSLRALYQNSGISIQKEVEAFSHAAASWKNAERFSGHLEEFVHRRVRRGEWAVLESHYQNWGQYWPSVARARMVFVLAAASAEGRVSALGYQTYLMDAADLAPFSWWGLRAAGLLDRPIEIRASTGIDKVGQEDLIARLFLKWGQVEKVNARVLDNPDFYNDDTVRLLARELAESNPRASIRIAGLLWRRPSFSPSREDLLLLYPLPYGKEARTSALGHGVPEEILYGLVRTESAWDFDAISRSGAQGLAQFMPATWEEWTLRMGYPADADPMDPVINLELGAAYLNWLLEREWTFGWVDSLASYNAGGGRVRGWRRDTPGLGDDLFGISIPFEEPRLYVGRVLSAATLYGYIYEGSMPGILHSSWGLPSF